MGEKAPRAGRQMAVHKAAHVSADQLRCERLKAHDAVDKIERDRACPDPDKDRGPGPPLPRIDDLMKHTEQQRAQSAAHEHVRGRPDILDDRELQPPEHSERDHRGASTDQPQGLLVRLQAWLLQQQAGEHAEETGADCGQRTEQTFGIPDAVPFPPGQVLRVDPVGEVRALRVGPHPDPGHSPTASSNPTTISSTIVVRHGTSSSTSLGASCPSDCANGPTGSDQWDLVLRAARGSQGEECSVARSLSSSEAGNTQQVHNTLPERLTERLDFIKRATHASTMTE